VFFEVVLEFIHHVHSVFLSERTGVGNETGSKENVSHDHSDLLLELLDVLSPSVLLRAESVNESLSENDLTGAFVCFCLGGVSDRIYLVELVDLFPELLVESSDFDLDLVELLGCGLELSVGLLQSLLSWDHDHHRVVVGVHLDDEFEYSSDGLGLLVLEELYILQGRKLQVRDDLFEVLLRDVSKGDLLREGNKV
jgi:hypothetical protein